jgi:hypothetical protein
MLARFHPPGFSTLGRCERIGWCMAFGPRGQKWIWILKVHNESPIGAPATPEIRQERSLQKPGIGPKSPTDCAIDAKKSNLIS